MANFRRIFWNVKEGFMGQKFFTTAPMQAMVLVALGVIPAQILFNFHKGSPC
jgi:hypothetical protein